MNRREISTPPLASGYPRLNLHKDGRCEHRLLSRLVCEVFHGPPPSDRHEAAHCNGDPSDNRASNLRWATPTENAADKELHGTAARGADCHSAKLTDNCVHIIRAMVRSGNYTFQEAADKFNVSLTTAWLAAKGKTWKHLPGATQ